MLAIILNSARLHSFLRWQIQLRPSLKKSVLNLSGSGLRKPFNLNVEKTTSYEGSRRVFATQSRILVQTLCKAGHAHKIKAIYCKNNKPNGCPSVCKDL